MNKLNQLNKRDLQQQIISRTSRDTALTNNWLKSRGLNEAELLNSHTLLLKAQSTASEMLIQHKAFIKLHKQEWLADFRKRCKSNRQRNRITDKECYAVLNYSRTILRDVFKSIRHSEV